MKSLNRRLTRLEAKSDTSEDAMIRQEMDIMGAPWWNDPPETKVIVIGGPTEQYCAGLEYLYACGEAKTKGLPLPPPPSDVVIRTVRELKEEYWERLRHKRASW